MSKLSDALDATGDKSCLFGRIVDKLDKPDREAVERYVAKYRAAKPGSGEHSPWSPGRLARLLREAGHQIGDTTVAKHMAGRCDCDSPE